MDFSGTNYTEFHGLLLPFFYLRVFPCNPCLKKQPSNITRTQHQLST